MDAPSLEERVQQSLDSVRPFLQQDGGDVEFVRLLPNGILELKWQGTCARCPMSLLTLRAGVERTLMRDLPEVKRVEAVQE
jgi:Fe-S cluster biogenesis protein NfuA